jgi:hypothetical protein
MEGATVKEMLKLFGEDERINVIDNKASTNTFK